MCMLIVVCPFAPFLLTIVLSVLLRFTDSDYPFLYLQAFLVMFAAISVYIDARFVSTVDCFVEGASCIYLRILITISDDVRVVKQ